MRTKQKKKIFILIFFISIIASATSLILSALQDNLLYFYTPTELKTQDLTQNQKIKIGGLVEAGSIVKNKGNLKVKFNLTDLKNTISVHYQGILPDLFREMQGVIVKGNMIDGVFIAQSVLAKHDENYMPAEIAQKFGYQKSGDSSAPKTNSFNYSLSNPTTQY